MLSYACRGGLRGSPLSKSSNSLRIVGRRYNSRIRLGHGPARSRPPPKKHGSEDAGTG
jgi:hypothetical protein